MRTYPSPSVLVKSDNETSHLQVHHPTERHNCVASIFVLHLNGEGTRDVRVGRLGEDVFTDTHEVDHSVKIVVTMVMGISPSLAGADF